MHMVPKTAFDVRRSATLPLSAIEQRVLEICRKAAEEGRELESNEFIANRIGETSLSVVPGVLKRLEAKGCITRTIYQKGRRVCIVSTGKCTLPPNDTSPHWRQRTDLVPSPAIHMIAERAKPLAAMIEAKAKSLGKPLSEFLMDCVYVGFHGICRDEE